MSIQNGEKERNDAGCAPRDVDKLQKSISELLQGTASKIPENLSDLLLKMSFYICSLGDQMNRLTDDRQETVKNVDALTKIVQDGFAEVHGRLDQFTKEGGVPILAGKATAESNSTSVKVPPPPVSKDVKVDQSKSKPPVSVTKGGPFDKKSTPSSTRVVAIKGSTDPLCFTYSFTFTVGSLTFISMEQAYHYIRFRFLKLADKAGKIKACSNADDLSNLTYSLVATSKDWEKEAKNVLFSLFMVRAEQCPRFKKMLVKEMKEGVAAFGYSSTDKYWGTGLSKRQTKEQKLEKWPGKNVYGVALAEFGKSVMAESEDGIMIETAPFDLGKYCKLPNITVNEDRHALVLCDERFANFRAGKRTKVIWNASVAKKTSALAVALKELQALSDLPKYGAIVFLFGCFDPQLKLSDFEKDYKKLLEFVTNKVSVPIFVTSIPPIDKIDSTRLPNYAIQTVVKGFNGKVEILDLHGRLATLPKLADFIDMKSAHFTDRGIPIVSGILAELMPFASLVPETSRSAAPGAPAATTVKSHHQERKPISSSEHRSSRGSASRPQSDSRNRGPSPKRGRPSSPPRQSKFSPGKFGGTGRGRGASGSSVGRGSSYATSGYAPRNGPAGPSVAGSDSNKTLSGFSRMFSSDSMASSGMGQSWNRGFGTGSAEYSMNDSMNPKGLFGSSQADTFGTSSMADVRSGRMTSSTGSTTLPTASFSGPINLMDNLVSMDPGTDTSSFGTPYGFGIGSTNSRSVFDLGASNKHSTSMNLDRYGDEMGNENAMGAGGPFGSRGGDQGPIGLFAGMSGPVLNDQPSSFSQSGLAQGDSWQVPPSLGSGKGGSESVGSSWLQQSSSASGGFMVSPGGGSRGLFDSSNPDSSSSGMWRMPPGQQGGGRKASNLFNF